MIVSAATYVSFIMYGLKEKSSASVTDRK